LKASWSGFPQVFDVDIQSDSRKTPH